MAKQILRVKMLGGFSLQYEDKEIVLDRNYASKSMQLLQMIFLNHKEGVSKKILIDALYGRDDVENKNGSLNNTIFRLRRQLKAAGLPGKNYINIQNGLCIWCDEIPLEIDCYRMEQCFLHGQKLKNIDDRMRYFMEGCQLYTGEFLPNMIGEDWVAVKNIYFQELYSSCLKELCKYLKEQGRFEEIYQLATSAAGIYPYEDWQIWRIDSLIAMARYSEAMRIYEKATKLVFDELRLPPSEEMLQRFHFMADRIEQASGAIDDIKQRLKEKEMTKGAYYCTFPSFVDIYHVISRMMERNGISVYIMLCTLKKGQKLIRGESERDKEISGILQDSIRTVLRKGDFYTKYNTGQFLVMLPGIRQENCNLVFERIYQEFFQYVKKGTYQLEYYVASVADICPDIS